VNDVSQGGRLFYQLNQVLGMGLGVRPVIRGEGWVHAPTIPL
jgi:hypothetical protein